MKTKIKLSQRTFQFLILSFCTFSSLLLAQGSEFEFSTIKLGWIGVLQDGGESGSGILQYTPRYSLSSDLSIGIDLGFTYLKQQNGSTFAAFEYLAAAEYQFTKDWKAGMEIGAQTWNCSGCSTGFSVGPVASYQLSPFNLHPEIWASYLAVFQPQFSNELRIGIGLHF